MVQADIEPSASSQKVNGPSEWLPIATAPKDGTHIILFWPFITQDGFVTTGQWYDPRDADGYWDSALVNAGATPPTHWMRCPAPPDAWVNFSNEPERTDVSLNQIPSTSSKWE